MRTPRLRRVILSLVLVTLGGLALLARPDRRIVMAEPVNCAWPLTSDGQSRFAAWSPDSRTVLVNRWGSVVGYGRARQTLSELWQVAIMDNPLVSQRTSHIVKYSENAIRPAYAADGQRLAYLAFAGGERWEARVLDVSSGRVRSLGAVDWRVSPMWVGETLAFARDGKVWLSDGGLWKMADDLPAVPTGTRVRLTADGLGAAWTDGTALRTVRTDGTGEGPRLVSEGAQVLSFVWSPDGRQLAYVVAPEGPSPELWTAEVRGQEASVLLAQGESELFSAPSWWPDGQTLAFSRTPVGAATASASDIWLVSAKGENLRPLLHNDLEESSPAWSPDGRYLAFSRAGDVWVVDMKCDPASGSISLDRVVGDDHEQALVEDSSRLASIVHDAAPAPAAQHTPPDTIRVKHHDQNKCREDVPEGRIDIIDFEEYVRHVVPAEMPASWAAEALKTQAVAVRTFGWKKVHYPSDPEGNYDVTDWTGDQLMCDSTELTTDHAVDATQGQYIAWKGTVIYALYSAENGSPTKTYFTHTYPDGVPYLLGVDDPVGFAQPIRGHGSGLSQWGAQRWARDHGWDYQQILAHYYTDVTIELPSTGGPLPIGSVTLPWSDYFVTGNRVYVEANASDEDSSVSAVGFYVVTDTRTLLVTDTTGSDGWGTVWDTASLTDTASKAITLSVAVEDAQGHIRRQDGGVRVGLDRHPPTDPAAAIDGAYTDTLTITLSSLSATDSSPGSGVQTMAFSNEGWTWEGESLYHESGTAVADEEALNGQVWCGLVSQHTSGAWYGPYTYDLPPGHAYRAYFRLKTDDVATTREVAKLDVVDNAGDRILGLRRLLGTDFRQADTYQEFGVDLNYIDQGTSGVEFRTSFRATADLCLDRVLVVGYPVALATYAQWRLTPGEGQKAVTIKFIDGAGNVSPDLTRTVAVDMSPPGGWRDFAPQWWAGGDAPTCTVGVSDEVSGLNVDSARYRFSTDGGLSWSDWATAECTGISGTTDIQTITAYAVPYGQPRAAGNRIEFQIADMTGHTGSMSHTVRGKPVYLPLIQRE